MSWMPGTWPGMTAEGPLQALRSKDFELPFDINLNVAVGGILTGLV